MARVGDGHMEQGTVTYMGKVGDCFTQKKIAQFASILDSICGVFLVFVFCWPRCVACGVFVP